MIKIKMKKLKNIRDKIAMQIVSADFNKHSKKITKELDDKLDIIEKGPLTDMQMLSLSQEVKNNKTISKTRIKEIAQDMDRPYSYIYKKLKLLRQLEED